MSTRLPNGRDVRLPHGGIEIVSSCAPYGWVRHFYTEWLTAGEATAPLWYYDSGMEYRYWIQYDTRLRPSQIVVPELEGSDVNYSPPEGYVMKKRRGYIVFFIDEQDLSL
jgi:hypothetical protein